MRKCLSLLIPLVFLGSVYAQSGIQLELNTVIEAEADGDNYSTYTFEATKEQPLGFFIDAEFTPRIIVVNSSGNSIFDSYNYYSSPIVFFPPDDGSYMTIVSSRSGDFEGSFSIEMQAIDIPAVTYGDVVERDPDGVDTYLFTLDAMEGDVVNIYAMSEGNNTILRVYTLDGPEIVKDDGRGPGANPHIRRFIFPDTATYLIALSATWDPEVLDTPVTLYVDQTEILPITSEPQTIFLGGDKAGDATTEILVFDDVNADTTYRLIIDTEILDRTVIIDVEVYQEEDRLVKVDTRGFFLRTSADFPARSDDRIFFTLNNFTS
ncbi:MAG: hypothetical protein AAF267_16135, partial [Deinococcota bacterium]